MIVDDIAITLQPQIGPRTAAHLLQVFGSADRIFAASREELVERAELRGDIAAGIVRKEYHRQAEKELVFCEKNGIMPIASTSDDYPPMLKECSDYPHVLYFKGDCGVLRGNMISMVGTRRITPYGQRVCEKLIEGVRGMFPDTVIVSGLAFGVDAACHRAALAFGLRTLAVLPGPLSEVYPSQHAGLAEEIIKRGGGLMSEYHSGTKSKGVNFIPRNRIIAGVSAGTIVVESPEKGGSLITAGMADGYDRCVMAVPGRVGDSCSEGTNNLIKSNRARMVCSAEDLAAELGWESVTDKANVDKVDIKLSREAETLLSCIGEGETVSLDRLSELSEMSIPEIASAILELEFERMIRVLPGKVYEKA